MALAYILSKQVFFSCFRYCLLETLDSASWWWVDKIYEFLTVTYIYDFIISFEEPTQVYTFIIFMEAHKIMADIFLCASFLSIRQVTYRIILFWDDNDFKFHAELEMQNCVGPKDS